MQVKFIKNGLEAKEYNTKKENRIEGLEMRVFYYAHTGHRIGLDRFRRAAAFINCMEDVDITLLTSDYRIASVAREYGVEKCVGIDVARNIANIAEKGDKLIFDSEEANPLMLEDMRNFFSSFVRVSDLQEDQAAPNECLISPYLEGERTCRALMVDECYFGEFEKDVAMTYFFGDDDYEKDLEKHLDFIEGLDVHLQMGFYYFIAYEEMLREKFKRVFEFEEYQEMIQRTDILITSSSQAVLESLASGGRPIYFQREDYPQDFVPLLKDLGVPVVFNYDKSALVEYIQSNSYKNYKKIEKSCYKIAPFIKNCLNL